MEWADAHHYTKPGMDFHDGEGLTNSGRCRIHVTILQYRAFRHCSLTLVNKSHPCADSYSIYTVGEIVQLASFKKDDIFLVMSTSLLVTKSSSTSYTISIRRMMTTQSITAIFKPYTPA